MNIEDKLLDKSKEAFVMAIEIYNKPTIQYRVEGFSFFICNAWELMIKSYMIKKFGDESIYYKDNPERSLTLENCIKKVFTNNKDPLRLNIEKIIELRNTSTHFITEEYEMVYIPLFQACVINFTEKMNLFHEFDITELIPHNFLTLSVSMKSINDVEITTKYPEQIAQKLLSTEKNVLTMSEENNTNFAINMNHYHYITKDKSKATSIVTIEKSSDIPVQIIKELKNPKDTHQYTTKDCIELINKQLKIKGISSEKMGLNQNKCFNMYYFQAFTTYFGLKGNSAYCFKYDIHKQPSYSYSIKTVDFIVNEIVKDPENILKNITKKS